MATLATTPTLSELNRFIAGIRIYPVSAGQLLDRARQTRASRRVKEFYGAFDRNRIFKDRDELSAATEQVEIMREESQTMPQEEFVIPEED